jgi:hypothetical protein
VGGDHGAVDGPVDDQRVAGDVGDPHPLRVDHDLLVHGERGAARHGQAGGASLVVDATGADGLAGGEQLLAGDDHALVVDLDQVPDTDGGRVGDVHAGLGVVEGLGGGAGGGRDVGVPELAGAGDGPLVGQRPGRERRVGAEVDLNAVVRRPVVDRFEQVVAGGDGGAAGDQGVEGDEFVLVEPESPGGGAAGDGPWPVAGGLDGPEVALQLAADDVGGGGQGAVDAGAGTARTP